MDLEEVEALFRRANAEERRARDEVRKPPPALAGVPRVGSDGAVVPDAVEYPLIEFPWEPWTLITPGSRSRGCRTSSQQKRVLCFGQFIPKPRCPRQCSLVGELSGWMVDGGVS
jgi:hypothetical protein